MNKFYPFAVLMVAALVGLSGASIEHQPVRVTHRNSGPSYDISEADNKIPDVVSSKLLNPSSVEESATTSTSVSNNSNKPESKESSDDAVGHLMIRRIFLVPMVPPRDTSAGDHNPFLFGQPLPSDAMSQGEAGQHSPLWSLLSPARHQHQPPHLYGADEASRNPSTLEGSSSNEKPKIETPAEGQGEREASPMGPARPPVYIDPIQMMLQMMHHAINSAPMRPPAEPLFPATLGGGDLNREASSDKMPELAGEKMPKPLNETREDVIEIEGKKFLRKTIINRHVGDNIVFMTRRLIFVPLNETDASTQTSTSSPQASDSKPVDGVTLTMLGEPLSTEAPSNGVPVSSEAPAASSSTTTTTQASEVTTTGSEQSSTTAATTDATTTTEGEKVDKEARNDAEVTTASSSTTTQKP